MKYQIIDMTDMETLEAAVGVLVEKDWKPLGGISVTHVPAIKDGRGAYFVYHQAIVKLEPHELK